MSYIISYTISYTISFSQAETMCRPAVPVPLRAPDSGDEDGDRPWNSDDERDFQDQQSPPPSPMQHSSGILPTWQKRVRTCLKHVRTTYVQCYSTSLLRTRVVHVHTFLKMYVHVHTFSEMYEHVHTVSVHGTYMFM